MIWAHSGVSSSVYIPGHVNVPIRVVNGNNDEPADHPVVDPPVEVHPVIVEK